MMDYLEEAIMGNRGRGGDDDGGLLELPPGFRFHPTDEEIITHYLKAKVMNSSFSATAIGEADFNKSEPWDLPKIATMGEKEWYFFSKRDRKYPTGMRTNRATETGYWKATGKDKEIYKLGSKSAAAAGGGGGGGGGGGSSLIGMKKTLVFYKGRAPKGEKSNWVMHEYRLEGQFSYFNLPSKSSKEEWVVSRVFHKGTSGMMKKSPSMNNTTSYGNGNDFYHNNILVDYYSPNNTLPPLMDAPPPNHHYTTTRPPPSSYTNQEVEYKATNTASFSAAASKLSSAYDGLNYTSYFSTPAAYNPPPPQPPTKYTILQDAPPPSLSNHHYGYQPTSEFVKVEQPQFSSSMVSISQDTGGGISTEMNNTEISSSSAGGGAGGGSAVDDDDHLAGYLWDY